MGVRYLLQKLIPSQLLLHKQLSFTSGWTKRTVNTSTLPNRGDVMGSNRKEDWMLWGLDWPSANPIDYKEAAFSIVADHRKAQTEEQHECTKLRMLFRSEHKKSKASWDATGQSCDKRWIGQIGGYTHQHMAAVNFTKMSKANTIYLRTKWNYSERYSLNTEAKRNMPLIDLKRKLNNKSPESRPTPLSPKVCMCMYVYTHMYI